MKRFNFRLQRVLDIKNTIEEAKRRDFLAAQSEYQKAVSKLQEFLNTLYKYQNKLSYSLGSRRVETALAGAIQKAFKAIYYQMGRTARSRLAIGKLLCLMKHTRTVKEKAFMLDTKMGKGERIISSIPSVNRAKTINMKKVGKLDMLTALSWSRK